MDLRGQRVCGFLPNPSETEFVRARPRGASLWLILTSTEGWEPPLWIIYHLLLRMWSKARSIRFFWKLIRNTESQFPSRT